MKKELSDQDQIFAEEISKDFGIPLSYLTNLISDLRAWKRVVPEKKDRPSVERKINADLIRILDSTDFKVKIIHIETETDYIHLFAEDPLFHLFNRAIKLFKDNFDKEMSEADKKWTKYINEWSKRQIFRYFIFYSRNHDLKLFDQRAVIGLFLVHFEVNFRKPIMTADQWVRNMTSADNYNDYLNHIVKYQHNKYTKELFPAET